MKLKLKDGGHIDVKFFSYLKLHLAAAGLIIISVYGLIVLLTMLYLA